MIFAKTPVLKWTSVEGNKRSEYRKKRTRCQCASLTYVPEMMSASFGGVCSNQF